MTRKENELFNYLRTRVASYIDGCVEYAKSYEGTWELITSYPSYFDSGSATPPPDHFTVRLHCYVLGPARHYAWHGRTWAKAFNEAKKDIETWIEGDAE